MTLYRPIGEKEKRLIEASGYQFFPPRLPHQPIFYPVLNEQYATEIAKKWNTKDPNSPTNQISYNLSNKKSLTPFTFSTPRFHPSPAPLYLDAWSRTKSAV